VTTLAIDVGGTTVSAGLVTTDYTLVDHESIGFERGIPGLHRCIQTLQHWANNRYTDVAIATPGKLADDCRYRISPGSAENLGVFLGEFDGFDWGKVAHSIFPNTPFFVENDAIAQLIGGWQDYCPKATNGIGYIGPGTGLGGGFLRLSPTPSILGDGHIFDILLPKRSPDNESLSTVMAEDVISGRGFFDRYGRSFKDATAANPSHPEIEQIAHYVVALITQIKRGHVPKKNPQNQWDDSTITAISSIRTWLIGGGMGHRLFPLIQSKLNQKNHDDTLTLITSPITAALKGVVYARNFR